jgi:hypothetical protein
MDLFTNNNIELSNIPMAENLVLNPIDPAYKKILVWSWLVGWGIVFISGFIYILTFSSVRNIFLIIIIAVMLIVMSFLFTPGFVGTRKNFLYRFNAAIDKTPRAMRA